MKNERKKIVILSIWLAVGLLAYSIIIFVLNKNVNPINITSTDYEAIHLRLLWRRIAETILAIVSLIYIVGHIVVVYFRIKNTGISIKTATLYFLIQVCLMMICTIPFMFFDVSYMGDYLFPLWETGGTLFLVLFVTVVISTIKEKR